MNACFPLRYFLDVCPNCDHHISEHYYNYEVDETSQEYVMECMLCGKGGDSTKLKNFDEVFGMKAHVTLIDVREQQGDIVVKEVQVDTVLVNAISKRAQHAAPPDDDDWED